MSIYDYLDKNLYSIGEVETNPDGTKTAKTEPVNAQATSVPSINPANIVTGDIAGDLSVVGGFIQSKNFVRNTIGWRLGADGTIEAVNTVLSGQITATSGTIGGFTIGATDLSVTSGVNTTKISSGATAISLGPTATPALTITQAGVINASRLNLNNYIHHTDASVTFTGTWSTTSISAYNGGSGKFSGTVGDYFEIAFSGKYISLFGERSAFGRVEIYVDTVLQATVSLESAGTFVRSSFWSTSSLAEGDHTLKLLIVNKTTEANDGMNFQGYSLIEGDGIKKEQISSDIYIATISMTVDYKGYVAYAPSTPSGYTRICLLSAVPTTTRMSLSGYVLSVTSITSVGTTATVTTSTNHGYATGAAISISGAEQAEYNGFYNITVTGGTTFTYTFAGSATSPATGTITCVRIIDYAYQNFPYIGIKAADVVYLYNGYPNTTYSITVSSLISKA